MSAVDVSPELRRALKRLCLGKILDALPERLALAREQKLTFEDVLLMLLSDEIQRRDGTAATRRAARAGLDPDMVCERWDKTAKVHYDRRVFAELCTLRFIEAHRNVVVLGPSSPRLSDTSPAAPASMSGSIVPMRCFECSDRVGWTTRAKPCSPSCAPM